MKIAVTFANDSVFQHFDHCQSFKVYETEGVAVLSSQVVSATGSGHGPLADFLKGHGVDTLICGDIDGDARSALNMVGIHIYSGVTGDADASVTALLACALSYNPNSMCNHHLNQG